MLRLFIDIYHLIVFCMFYLGLFISDFKGNIYLKKISIFFDEGIIFNYVHAPVCITKRL